MVEARSHLMERKSQWLYFNRNLCYYEGPRTYMMKPLQRMQWTRTQAIEDARSIIADSLQAESPALTVRRFHDGGTSITPTNSVPPRLCS